MTIGGKYAKPSKNNLKRISAIESLLIGACLDKNPKLMNIHQTSTLRNTIIPGFLNSPKGHPGKSAKELNIAIH